MTYGFQTLDLGILLLQGACAESFLLLFLSRKTQSPFAHHLSVLSCQDKDSSWAAHSLQYE